MIAPALLFVCLLLLGAALQRRYRGPCLWLAGAIALFFLTSAALISYQRNDPQPNPGELKHVERDGWGSAPTGETTMYLVYDPSDALWNAAKQGKDGAMPGIPCPVDRVHRLETHWYTVLYPIDFGWADCRSVGGTHQ